MFLHCTTFAAENTDLQYTNEHRMPVRPEELFDRMVMKHKGSYCFGQNGLFLGVLRGLGYRAYPVFGRVLVPSSPKYPPDSRSSVDDLVYTNQSHMLLLVQSYPQSDPLLGNVTFVVDVGFAGLLGPLRPILLDDGEGAGEQQIPPSAGTNAAESRRGWVWGTLPPVRHRVVKGAHYASSLELPSGSGNAPLRDWHMQVNKSPIDPKQEGNEGWTTLYTFSEAEIFQRDIDTANYIVYTYDAMPFRDSMLCCKRLPLTQHDLDAAGYSDRDEDDRTILQTVAARKDIKWGAVSRVGSKIVEEVQLGSEVERLRFLRDTIGLGLDEDDVQWIEGRAAAF
ncbi:cysteine proteinase [Irpex lacteus]|nr:cysteine proteinase [Irpex lacteus]